MHEDEAPWQTTEADAATGEWFDESPFAGVTAPQGEWTETEWTEPEWTESEWAETPTAEGETWGPHRCAPGEGPPAAPVGPRPLLHRSTSAARARNPAVGYAQDLLNRFLASWRAGTPACSDTSQATRQYIASLQPQLKALGQDPLVIDCRFGQGTELATKMFQACRGLVRDGVIGPKTWPELEKLAATPPTPAPTPTPTPTPGPTPTGDRAVRVREDVWTLSATNVWHPTILWYARAVAALQARDKGNFADPRGWRHLAETHGTDLEKSAWPAGARWNACEHQSWHFLPWHRVYLHHFERIVRDEIVRLGGPPGWALPFWNYSDASRPDVAKLPPAFLAPRTPDNVANPLAVSLRSDAIKRGDPMSARDVAVKAAMDQTTFTDRFMPGFGGRMAPVGTHEGGPGMGVLEATPHGAVHIAVGGRVPAGLMSRFETAGQDPIFWLHHANIDRLWQVWLRQPGRLNPKDPGWLKAKWTFGVGRGRDSTSLTTREVLDPRRAPLRYRYSDMPEREAREAFGEPLDEGEDFGEEESPPPELVGASTSPVPIRSGPSIVPIDVSTPRGPAARLVGEGGVVPPNARIYLRLENITASRLSAGPVVVHVNVPAGARATEFPDREVGQLPMFGLIESSRRTDTHSGSGMNATFEITKIVKALSAAGQWDPKKLQVSFTPLPDPSGRTEEGDISVGRVSLFYA